LAIAAANADFAPDAERIDDLVRSSTKMTLMSCTSAFTGTWFPSAKHLKIVLGSDAKHRSSY
jgi:hypothetical protein